MAKPKPIKAHTRKRSGTGALKRLRKEGLIPAVVYGKGQPATMLRLDRKTVLDILSKSVSEQILVNLEIEDTKQNQLALIQEVTHNALNGSILHIDFHAVKENEPMHAHVPINFVGDAVGVKSGGLMEVLTHSLNIICLPLDLPERIDLDVTNLGLGQALHVSDLQLPAGVKTLADSHIVVALIAELKGNAEPAPTADAAPAAKKGAAKKAAAAPAAPAAKKAAKK
jgi:large subunit ribosomal protein L25